jgi:hypothetical protein
MVCNGLVECLRYTLDNPFAQIGLSQVAFDPLTIIIRIVQALALSLWGNPLF